MSRINSRREAHSAPHRWLVERAHPLVPAVAVAALFFVTFSRAAEAPPGSPEALVPAGTFGKPAVLNAETYRHYVDTFNQNDNQLYAQHIPNAAAWDFLKDNIPLLDCPDGDIEEIYYFRWWTFRKHIKQTPDGFVITEFLPPVPWAGQTQHDQLRGGSSPARRPMA